MNKITMNKIRTICALIGVLVLSASCYTTEGIHSKRTKAWGGGVIYNQTKTLAIGEIRVDKSGDGWLVEKEIAALLPLLCFEDGFLIVENKQFADCIVDVYATERDYAQGWNKKKSMTMEVSFRKVVNQDGYEDEGEEESTSVNSNGELCFAAGRTVAQGSLGFSSSKNLESLLSVSLKELIASTKSFLHKEKLG
jgi:hypothetical protein